MMRSSIWQTALVVLGRIFWRTCFDLWIFLIGVRNFQIQKATVVHIIPLPETYSLLSIKVRSNALVLTWG